MNKAKELLDKHLNLKGITNEHIHIAAYNSCLDAINEAINYSRSCETLKEKYTHTFEVDLNSEKRQQEYNEQIKQIHNAPCKVYFYDGEKYIEFKP